MKYDNEYMLWRLIIKCHNINKQVHKGTRPTRKEEFLYKQKSMLLDTIVARYKGLNNPKIELGWSIHNGMYIIYFQYEGSQFSFHSYEDHGVKLMNIPMDTIQWDGEIKYFEPWDNKRFPGLKIDSPKPTAGRSSRLSRR